MYPLNAITTFDSPHPSPPPQRGEGIFLALNAFLAKLPSSSITSAQFWVKLSARGEGI